MIKFVVKHKASVNKSQCFVTSKDQGEPILNFRMIEHKW